MPDYPARMGFSHILVCCISFLCYIHSLHAWTCYALERSDGWSSLTQGRSRRSCWPCCRRLHQTPPPMRRTGHLWPRLRGKTGPASPPASTASRHLARKIAGHVCWEKTGTRWPADATPWRDSGSTFTLLAAGCISGCCTPPHRASGFVTTFGSFCTRRITPL